MSMKQNWLHLGKAVLRRSVKLFSSVMDLQESWVLPDDCHYVSVNQADTHTTPVLSIQ